jgi:hypothetical protein
VAGDFVVEDVEDVESDFDESLEVLDFSEEELELSLELDVELSVLDDELGLDDEPLLELFVDSRLSLR